MPFRLLVTSVLVVAKQGCRASNIQDIQVNGPGYGVGTESRLIKLDWKSLTDSGAGTCGSGLGRGYV